MENGDVQKCEKPNLRGDIPNLLLLTFLYVLQGIPYGLSLAVPLILQKRHVTYADQTNFSFAQYSFCFKIFSAPIVDCVFSKRMGRRKTWLIPTQYLIGTILLIISMNVEDWLGSEDGQRKPKIHLLVISFFLCIFICSWQDVAVDGWSLTMLKRRNIGHASSCYSVGYACGQFLAFFLFINLGSKDFANMFRSVPRDEGFVSFAGFLLFWSIVFYVATTLILVFKKDNSLDVIKNGDECRLGLKESYRRLWMICHIRPVQTLCLLLFTCQVIFGPVQGVTQLKLVDAGVTPAKYALLTVPSLPFQFVLPFALSDQLTGPRSMRAFVVAYLLKCVFGLLFTAIVFIIPYIKYEKEVLPTWYYWILLVTYNVDNLTMYAIWISALAFFSRVSDARFGGMYLTVLNTVTNIGYYWPISASLGLLQFFTIQTCSSEDDGAQKSSQSTCKILVDGYYVEVIFFTVIGFIWLCWSNECIRKLEKLDPASWKVDTEQYDTKEKQPITGRTKFNNDL